MLQRGGERAREHVEDLGNADTGCRNGRHQWKEATPCDSPFQIAAEKLGVEWIAIEVAIHERLVLALRDDAFEKRIPC